MSETINKVLDAAQAVTTEPMIKVVNQRLSNPFFLCFISSWVLCNWDRVLLLLFSFSLGMEQRIEKVKALPSNSVFFGVSISHTHTFWYPFFASIIFVVGAPFISYVVDVIQNGVLTKKNANDSNRKQGALDLKIEEINKKVKYEYAEARARLNAEKENKAIEYDTIVLEDKFNDAQVKLRDINVSIKEKESEIQAQTNSYNNVMNAMSVVRKELESKEKELMDLNSKIIAGQNKLDAINQKIPNNTFYLAGDTLGSEGFQGIHLNSGNSRWPSKPYWGGVSDSDMDSANHKNVNHMGSNFIHINPNRDDEKKNK
ncbi:TPA: hypothetical protein ACNVB5_003363 [Citrobacter freundii]